MAARLRGGLKCAGMNDHLLAAALLATTAFAANLVPAKAESSPPPDASAPARGHETSPQAVEQGAAIRATLLDQRGEAAHHTAAVLVQVQGLKLVDPDAVHDKAAAGQGHLHYRLDGGPEIATTATKLGFEGLKDGPHNLTISLVGNDHMPLGPSQTLTFDIP